MAIKAVAILSRNTVAAARPCCILVGIHIVGAFYQNTQFPSGQEPEAEWSRLRKRESHSRLAPQHPSKGKLCTTCSMERSEVNPPGGELEAKIHFNVKPPRHRAVPSSWGTEKRNILISSFAARASGRGHVGHPDNWAEEKARGIQIFSLKNLFFLTCSIKHGWAIQQPRWGVNLYHGLWFVISYTPAVFGHLQIPAFNRVPGIWQVHKMFADLNWAWPAPSSTVATGHLKLWKCGWPQLIVLYMQHTHQIEDSYKKCKIFH